MAVAVWETRSGRPGPLTWLIGLGVTVAVLYGVSRSADLLFDDVGYMDVRLARAAEQGRADVRSCEEGQTPAGRADACPVAPYLAATGVREIAADAALCAGTRSGSAFCQDTERAVEGARERLRQAERRIKERVAAAP